MDKESSVNCTRVTLIVSNLLCLLVGVSGFILGFARPNALQFVSVSGLQVSLASLCLIWAASVGVFAAITLHYRLLLSYAAIIISSFLLRIVWSITAYIHSTVFILDCSASTTILATIASFFLMLFALLLANNRTNEDATSKAKLIQSIQSVSPVNGATKNSILKGTLNNNLKKKSPNHQKNILSSVNYISAPGSVSASPSPTTLNQSSLSSPSSHQSSHQSSKQLQQPQHTARHHHQTKPLTINTKPTATQHLSSGKSSATNNNDRHHNQNSKHHHHHNQQQQHSHTSKRHANSSMIV